MLIDLNNYKNIIFDLGGVILNIDYQLTADAFRKLGLLNFDEHYTQAKQRLLFDRYEKGLITSDAFRSELMLYIKADIDGSVIDNAWNAMLLDLPDERLELLKKIKKTRNTFLLSNTNEIHIDAFYSYLKEKKNITDFSSYFNKIYFSHKINLRKPDLESFEFILKKQHLRAAETLFIDDSMQHIEGAKKLGIHTYWLDVKKESIVDVFGA